MTKKDNRIIYTAWYCNQCDFVCEMTTQELVDEHLREHEKKDNRKMINQDKDLKEFSKFYTIQLNPDNERELFWLSTPRQVYNWHLKKKKDRDEEIIERIEKEAMKIKRSYEGLYDEAPKVCDAFLELFSVLNNLKNKL